MSEKNRSSLIISRFTVKNVCQITTFLEQTGINGCGRFSAGTFGREKNINNNIFFLVVRKIIL